MQKSVCIKYISLFIFLLIIFSEFLFSKTNILVPGEELTYEVSYLGIKLGTIKIVTDGIEKYEGKQIFKVKGFIDSYSGIPFVDLHYFSQSWLDQSVSYSHKFIGNNKDDDKRWTKQIINFDYVKNTAKNSFTQGNRTIFERTYSIDQKCNEGLSIFFLARRYCGTSKTLQIPTLVDKDLLPATIFFTGSKETVEIDIVKYPIRTVYFSGQADWVGLYGLTGSFEGWFSDDEARVPIKAKMKVYIGNVDIQLIDWKRPDWAPPKAE